MARFHIVPRDTVDSINLQYCGKNTRQTHRVHLSGLFRNSAPAYHDLQRVTQPPFIAGPLAVSQSAIFEIDAGIKAYR
jgi:hypothetical protein